MRVLSLSTLNYASGDVYTCRSINIEYADFIVSVLKFEIGHSEIDI